MKKYILSIGCLVIFAFGALAQKKTVTVSGTIVDEQGMPMIGATVVVRDKPGLGVASDIDGHYKIEVEPFNILSSHISAMKPGSIWLRMKT